MTNESLPPAYLLIAIGPNGARCGITTQSTVPDEFVQPGEVAFVVQPLDIRARHNHEGPKYEAPRIESRESVTPTSQD